MKKILTLIGACAIVFAMGGIAKVNAGLADSATGFIWGGTEEISDGNPNNGLSGYETGIGWISLNCTNQGSCAMANYGVSIPLGVSIPFLADGPVTGYAWSENLGYIDFSPQNHCGSAYTAASCTAPGGGNGGVTRTGNNLTGWARIVEIAKASATGNSGGYSGWIHMNGPTYGVVIDPIAGKISNYAWSDEFGYISFSGPTYGGKIPPPPIITMNPNTPLITINVKDTPLPQTETLTWSSTNTSSCKASSTNGTWPTGGIALSGSHDVHVNSGMTETFTITCKDIGGWYPDATYSVKISTVCYPQTCAAQVCDDNATPYWGVSDTSTCSPTPSPSTCVSNDDCIPRSTGSWTEIAP